MSNFDLRPLIGRGDALIVIPPFAGLDRPSLAAHTLQACAAEAGFRVRVLYANLLLAKEIGDSLYTAICFAPTSSLLGERFFARSAYGVPQLGRDDPVIRAAINDISGQVNVTPDEIRDLETRMTGWVEHLAAAIAECRFPVVGFSTTFEQTAASVALLNRVKALQPETITLLGGANCEGVMAEGLLTLPVQVDYIFNGESEDTFPAFLEAVASGNPPQTRIVQGTPCRNLDAVPVTNFDEFFEQRDAFLPHSAYASSDIMWLPYEGSRGCWWGEKHHCTFCGINGTGMDFRERSADRLLHDLRSLSERHQIKRICMTDNIMPHKFFRTFIPRVGDEVPGLYMFYEQKANLTLEQVAALQRSGVKVIQPGIEALSSDLLKRMDKGVSARQNMALLRYARAANLEMNWNLLYGFPGDGTGEYLQTLNVLKRIRHLQPPNGFFALSIDRFSPYFFAKERYGIRSIRPMPSYFSVLPEGADVSNIAYHFIGDYDTVRRSNPAIIERVQQEIDDWKACWESAGDEPPVLAIVQFEPDRYMILDTRGMADTTPVKFVDREHAAAALIAHPMHNDTATGRWAREQSIALELEGWHVPLATASVELLSLFEKEAKVTKSASSGVFAVIEDRAQPVA
jgi:ribosomal peptide maturation radical SAM protein 1